MCSVPGVPTPGSEVSIIITRVNINQNCGLVELWVNMNKEIKHVYEQMQEEIQLPKRNFCGSEGTLGDLCLVSVDGKWHRGRIVSMREENYEVFLIDQAQPHSTTSAALAWGKDECFILPPEIESCMLANVLSIENNWPERAINFLKSLPGKEFKGLVQHALMPDRIILLDVPTISKHLCKEGVAKRIPGDEFKNLVLKCLSVPAKDSVEPTTTVKNFKITNQLDKSDGYFYPELFSNTFESIRVTEVIDPESIFCELVIFSISIKKLTEQLNKELNDQSGVQDLQPQIVGMPCAAKGLDGNWRRAVLKQPITFHDSTVAVFFVDEGKYELVQAANVKRLDSRFLRMPVVTYRCILEGHGDKKWTKEEFDHLKSLLLTQNIVARFERHILPEDIYSVSFFLPNATCINNFFSNKEGLAINGNAKQKFKHKPVLNDATHEVAAPNNFPESLRQHSFSKNCCSPFSPNEMPLCDLLTVGASVGVKISCIDSPKKFWCQTSQCDKKLHGLMKDLQVHYASVYPKPLVEQICVARNPDNDMWCRAKILDNKLSPNVEVRFIDYGETKKVPLQELRPIDPTFLRLDAQAFQCSLFNIPATHDNYLTEEFYKFISSNSAQTSGLKCVIKAVASDEDGLPLNVVELQTQSENASQVLTEKLASRSQMLNQSSLEISMNSREKIHISYSQTVHNFYSQLDRNVHLFQHVQNNIEKLVKDSMPLDSQLSPNSLCIAKDSDSNWYRGQVLETSPDLKVYLVDFGKTVVVSKTNVHPFPSEASAVRAIPTLAIPMALFNIPTEIPQEINEWFAKKVVGSTFSVSVIEEGQNGKLMVELFDGLKNVNAQVREKMVSIGVENRAVCSGSNMAPASNMEIDECEEAQQNKLEKLADIQSGEQDMEDWILVNIEPTYTPTNKEFPEMIIETTTDPTSAMEIDEGNKNSQETNKVTRPDNKKPSPKYKKPILTFNKTQELQASFISTPEFFFCQCSNRGDLDNVTALAQIEGKAAQDPLFPTLLLNGHPCLAFSKSDNQWYRAQVIQKYDKTFTVLYIDYGNEEMVACKDVRPLSDRLLEVAPQAFLCTLDDITFDKYSKKKIDKFHHILADKPLKVKVLRMGYNTEVKLPQYTVQIEDVGSHRFLQNCGIISGGNVLNQSLKEGAKTIFYSNPNDLLNKTVKVYASSISSPAYFWCQYNNDKELDRITKLAQKSGGADDPLFSESLIPGSPCLALYSVDNEWCRAQVISREMDKFNVVFIDYGNEEAVPILNVRPMPWSLKEVEAQAFLCCVENFSEDSSKWDDALYDAFQHILLDKIIVIKIVSMEHNEEVKVPQYTVRFDFDLEKCCSTYAQSVQKSNVPKIVSQNTTAAPPPEAPNANMMPSQYMKPQLAMNQTVMAYASSISGTDYFWCQYSDPAQLDEITILSLNKSYALYDFNFTKTLTPGCPCLAFFSEDKEWCRAQILSTGQDKFKVLFIDHGNEDEVSSRNVRPISMRLLKIPPQAFLCRLEGFNVTAGAWKEEIQDHFFSLLVDNLLKVTPSCEVVNEETKLPQFIVQIQCGDMAVNNVMQQYWKAHGNIDNLSNRLEANLNVSMQMIFKKPIVSPDSVEQAYATCIVDPGFFWCQFANSDHLDQIQNIAEEAGQSQKRPETLNKGDLCLALFSSDKKWYRALVGKKTDDKLNMLFIDYGNEAEVTIDDTRLLPQSLMEQPPQAFLCMLHGFNQTKGTWEDQGCDEFFELLVDKVLNVKIVTMEDNQEVFLPQYLVEIDCEGANVNKLMEKYWRGDPSIGAGECQGL